MAKTINTGFDDAQSVNQSSKTTFVYRDISLYFTPNPVSGDVTQITDVQDIKRSVRNLVLTNRWDRPFHPEIASRVREALFDMFTPVTINIIRNAIEDVLRIYEPRVDVTEIAVEDPEFNYMDQNTLPIKIFFTLKNAPETLENVNVVLERIRLNGWLK